MQSTLQLGMRTEPVLMLANAVLCEPTREFAVGGMQGQGTRGQGCTAVWHARIGGCSSDIAWQLALF